jgi:hypothetical protein
MRAALVLALVCAAPVSGQARIQTELDTTLVTVGDRLMLTVSIDHSPEASVSWPDSLDMSPFEVLEARVLPVETSAGGARSTAILTMTVFELGELELPSLEVIVSGPGGATEVLRTDRYGVEVVTVGADEGGDIREIRGPLWIPVSVVRIALWGLLLLLLLGLAIVAYRRMRRPEPEVDIRRAAAPLRPAHEVALEALATLEASPTLERGQIKEYHIEVSDIVRRYVEERFHVEALEMTTREVLAGLAQADVDPRFREGLRRFLDQCDLVKFAKVRPDAAASLRVLTLGRELVVSTMPSAGIEDEPPLAEAS